MRLSELLDTPVYDVAGVHVGDVHDVRLSHEMAALPATAGARTIRIEHLVLRNSVVGVRLGYGRREMKGPPLLARLLIRWSQKSPVVAWADIATRENGRITLHRRAEELQTLGDLGDTP